MRSMFLAAPFSRFDLGRYALAGSRPYLGQSPQTVFALSDYIEKISNIADKETRDALKKKYDECRDKGLDSTAGLVCLASLSSDVYSALRNQDKNTPPPPVVPVPQPSTIPIIPIAIATLGAGALIWFLATRGKKS